MNKAQRFLKTYEKALLNKNVVLTGCTGGIGKELCRFILSLGGNLLMVDRNEEKSAALKKELLSVFPSARIGNIKADMSDIKSVKSAVNELKNLKIDYLIHNAGAYKIPRMICENGYDNVFNINFISPYYITKSLLENVEHFIIVGSIANYYSKADFQDIDFKNKTASSLVYGNAKRYLIYSHFELFKNYPQKRLSVTHPGITLTGITDHYPKWLFPILKPIMKIIFMKPKNAALCILEGLFTETEPYIWIGPKFFNIWGKPSLNKIRKADDKEISFIYQKAEGIYDKIQKDCPKV